MNQEFKSFFKKSKAMSKFHEILKNVKKSPQKSAKEKRAEKRERRAMKNESINLKKVFEEKEK
ncbi:hypothetical protein D1614_20485 [Maribellus luteus]|uniref:Uncharacterized protein n=1 Tax=Maribellus luteus TaxID=2305463 RepID=A0A399SVX7_9BACT|nr:hypothetical protein D1614_20485 [Maribellus luteus]